MSTVPPHHQQWFDHCTQLFSHRGTVSADNQVKIDLAALQSYSKVSTLYEKYANFFSIQSSPLFAMPCGYHRSTPSRLLETVQRVAAEKLGLEQEAFQLVNSPLICENLQRELEGDKTYIRIASEEDFIKACEKLHVPNSLSFSFNYSTIFDFTSYMQKNNFDPKRFQEQIVKKFTPSSQSSIQ